MKMLAFRAAALPCALLATTCLTAPAIAQSSGQPSIYQNLDGNGVDLTDGSFNFSLVEGSIGSGEGALALVRSYGAGGETDNLRVRFRRTESGGTATIDVTIGNRRETFSGAASATSFTSGQGNGATLTKISVGEYRHTDAGGTVTVFREPTGLMNAANNGFCSTVNQFACELVAVTTTRPNGHVTTYDWNTGQNCTITYDRYGEPIYNCAQFWRLRGMHNNLGYKVAFTFQQEANPTSGLPGTAWHTRASASFTNTSVASPARTVSYSYPSSTVTQVTTDGGQVWRLTRDASYYLVGIRRPGAASDTITISRNASGKVSQVTTDGVTTNYNYSVSGSTATMVVTNALSQTATVVSDLTKGRPTSVTDTAGRTSTATYDSMGRPDVVTMPEGNKIDYNYDSRGNVTQTSLLSKGGALAAITTSASFPSTCTNVVTCNKPTSTTDARGNVTDYSYDGTHGGLLSVTLPAAPNGVRPQTRFTYGAVNGVTMATQISACRTQASCTGSADESRTTIGYGANNLPTSITRSAGDNSLVAVETMTWTAYGDVNSVDGPLSGTADTIYFRYDAARRPIGTISPDPDGAGAMKRRAQRRTYGTSGELTKVESGTVPGTTDADWANFVSLEAVETVYDSNLRPTVQKLVAGGATHALAQTSYDALGRPDCVAQRMNPAAFGSLPAACSLGTQGSHGPDRIVRTIYTAGGEVSQQLTAYGTAQQAAEYTATYTSNGHVATVTDGENNRTTYIYDAHDRLSQTRFPVTAQGASASSTTDYLGLTYDAAGNVTQRRLRDGNVINYTYDALNRVILKDHPAAGTAMAAETDTQYAYDNFGRLTWSHVPANSTYNIQAQYLTYSYDALGRMVAENGRIGAFSSQYDLAGRRTRLTHPDGFYVTHEYLVTGEMTTIRENGSALLASFAYDDLGRRTMLTRGNGTTTGYTYDAASRLSQLVEDLGGTAHDQTLAFSYSPANQIASNARSNDAYAWTNHYNVSRGYTANGLNQYTASGSVNPTYDTRGNLTSAGGPTYLYNAENRLRSASGQAELFYDPVGRLVQMNASSSRWYGYDGPNRLIESNGAVQNPYDRRFVFGPGSDEALVWYEGSGTSDRRYLHADERGSIVAVTNQSGTAIGINAYDEYGIPASTNIGRFQYTGQAWLPEIGMYHYKARIYSPSLGRFLQTDPIGYGDGMNMYAYVGNDPVNAVDPTGLAERGFSLFWRSYRADGGGGGPGGARGGGGGGFVSGGCGSAGGNAILVCGSIGTVIRAISDIGMHIGLSNTQRSATGALPRESPPIVVVGTRPKRISSCMRNFLASQGLSSSNLGEVMFVRGMDATRVTRAAHARGMTAITRGNTVYVRHESWDRVTNPLAGITYFEEIVHTVQAHLSGARWTDIMHGLGAAMTILGGDGDGYPNHLEVQAKGAARRLFDAYRALPPSQRCND